MIKIIADTLSTIPLDVAAEQDIAIMPQIVIFGETSYRDDTEIDTATFLEKLRASPVLPTTSAPPPGLYVPVLEQLVAAGHEVLCLAPSAELSRTFQSAHVAAENFAGVHVLDTRSVAAALGVMVLMAARWAREGADVDTIVERVRGLMARQRIYFLVDTLEYLHKGGRIGGAKALLGGLLKIKPILAIQDGRVEPYEQQRTKRRALARLKELVAEQCPLGPESHLTVMHAGAEDEARQLALSLAQQMAVPEVPVTVVPPAIAVHAGPGVLGVGFFVQ
ncbi:MAG: DegV family protein [Anaerolineae bacterium]|nr:DegV family protein [Anaerolineae bacterium]